ncbi:MAG: pyridoxamine 5'-phosphate oxidase family protein [Hyphomicrobiaceae bacterium]|nr:pyridoxamine 5'-phosphate oxidase family protein [Hyphomicrobiaceae bacterium]
MSNRLQPPHYNDLDAILPTVWDLLARGARGRNSEFHILHLATISAEGYPNSRSVVLRGFDVQTRSIQFHTDSRSAKAAEIFERPHVSIHAYSRSEKVQLRMQCRASFHHCDALTGAAWRTMHDMSRECYRQVETPGRPIETPTPNSLSAEENDTPPYENFAVVIATIQRLEWLFLSAAGHRRALFDWRHGELQKSWLAV